MKQHGGSVDWVGTDVSKKTFDAALARSEQRFPSTPLRALPWETFPRTRVGVKKFLAWLDGLLAEDEEERPARVVMEATGDYSVELTAWLVELRPELTPAIENARRTKAFIDSLGQRNKTDGLDARGLAFYGVERRPSPYEPLTPERQQLRAVTRYRDVLVQNRTALKNRLHERCASAAADKMRKRQLKQLDKDIAALEAEMKRIIGQAPSLKKDFDLLLTIAGIGFITAAIVLAELGDLRRFQRARQLTAHVGVSPRKRESGTSILGKTRMCKTGNGRVRQALFMASMAAIRTRYDNGFKQTHAHLCREGKSGKCALGAVMRKQLTVMRAILISGKAYEPMWKTQHRIAATHTKTGRTVT